MKAASNEVLAQNVRTAKLGVATCAIARELRISGF
jgi:hypothetical protein